MSTHFTDEVLERVVGLFFHAIEAANLQAELDEHTTTVAATLQDVTADQFIRYVQGNSTVHRLSPGGNFTCEVRPAGHEDRRNCITLFCKTPPGFDDQEFEQLVLATVRVRSETGQRV
mgnify:CR=1 FL=1|jgi:hypothetical protein